MDREQRIRERAHAIWEAEGRPHGRHEEFWARAEEDVRAQEASSQADTKSVEEAMPAASTPAKAPRGGKARTGETKSAAAGTGSTGEAASGEKASRGRKSAKAEPSADAEATSSDAAPVPARRRKQS